MNSRANTCPDTLSMQDIVSVLGINKSTVKRRIDRQLYRAETVTGNGGMQYRIAFDSLPPSDQVKVLKHVRASSPAPASAPVTLTTEEAFAAREAFDKLPGSVRQEGVRRWSIMMELRDMAHEGVPKLEQFRRIEERHGVSEATVRRWKKAVAHLKDYRDWQPVLAPGYKGGRPEAEMSPEVWEFIKREWLCQSQPPVTNVYRAAVKVARREGLSIPSEKTVLRRLMDIPRLARMWWREGEEAVAKQFPPIQRDYSTLELHQMWVSDGRKADVFCRWPDGIVGRPIVMAWQELRTRKVLGWSVGQVEDSELVRLSFRAAAQRSGALPTEAYLDNGRAYASKQITGGQATRNRFNINPEDPFGILTLFNIKAVWATPYHGQSKPIESYWNTIAQAEKCKAFAGAYCGNRPDAKPEEFDPRKAVDLADYVAFLAETIAEKNSRAHRGDSMLGRSPDALYAELWESAVARRPTAEQLRLCMQAAENVRLDADHGVNVLGNRYWCETLAELPHRGPYTVRFNPADAAEPVAVFNGDEFICEAPITLKTGFRDMETAKTHEREKRRELRAIRDRAKAIAGQDSARQSWAAEPSPASPAAPAEPMPAAKVVGLVQPGQEVRRVTKQDKQEAQQEERRAHQLALGRQLDRMQAESERRRAAGGM